MRRNLIASLFSTLFVFAGFACGAANSELYAVMPSEAESASASASARGSASAVPGTHSASAHAIEEPEAQAAPEEVEEVSGPVGILGLIGGPDSSAAAWGSVLGAGSAQGFGGLGLSGIGTGGIGLGSIGTGSGYGHGAGIATRGGTPPRLTMGKETVVGKLPPEVIKRIVRQNHGRFRLCYENGLRTNPKLEGRITVRFVISRSGDVATVSNAGSTMPSQPVITCVVNSFRTLSFPQPDGGGIVVVTYPITFSPGVQAPAPAASSATP